jgi:two-component sensor histidine kinase
LCRILLQEEYGDQLDFVEAPSARRGLELCAPREPRPDCLLLDYKLPDLTGVEFLRRLDDRHVGSRAERHGLPSRSIAKTAEAFRTGAPADLPEFAVVMLTGLGNEQVAAEAMRAGAQDYLVKDRITSESLRLAIEKATGKVGLLRALQSERDRLARMLAEKDTLLAEKETLLAEKQSLLDEKDALLQEVQHRVKNNLQVIASLLRMQAEKFAGDDTAARLSAALRESQNRVESMSLIHEQLYQAGNLREVDLAEHAALLANHLMHAYGANPSGTDPARIECRLNIERLPVGVDRAIPAALILNELVSNALKHAFLGDRLGVIEITGGLADLITTGPRSASVAAGGTTIFLEVRDNGIGFAAPSDRAASSKTPGSSPSLKSPGSSPSLESLGLNIVRILTRQLRGKFTIENAGNAGGSICRLTFPSTSISYGERQGEHHASEQSASEHSSINPAQADPKRSPKQLRCPAG